MCCFTTSYNILLQELHFTFRFSTVEPNFSHKVLKELEDIGKVSCVVTQNVDRLHTKAGTKNVVELHGTAFVVMCLNCDFKMSRLKLQDVFNQLNPNVRLTSDMIRPDGDVELSQVPIHFNFLPNYFIQQMKMFRIFSNLIAGTS